MVVEEMNLLDYDNREEENSPLYEKSLKQASRKSTLEDRQHRLMDWLEENFIPSRYYSIEEIVDRVVDSEGKPYYKLNTNPYNHDKCVALSNDVRTINWTIVDRYHIILKDNKGGIKLCESKEEFEAWKEETKAPLIKKLGYLSNLEWKEKREGTMPLINLKNRVLSGSELGFVEVNARGKDDEKE